MKELETTLPFNNLYELKDFFPRLVYFGNYAQGLINLVCFGGNVKFLMVFTKYYEAKEQIKLNIFSKRHHSDKNTKIYMEKLLLRFEKMITGALYHI